MDTGQMRRLGLLERSSNQHRPRSILNARISRIPLGSEGMADPQMQQQEQEEEEKKGAPPPLEVTLRPFELSDVDAMMVWTTDDKVTPFCSWETYTCREDVLAYLQDKVLPHPWFRAICVGGRPVGAISLLPASGNERCRGELGYVLASAYWGKGIVTAAVRAAVRAVFGEVEGLERVEALVDVGNPASQRVLEKVGFKREGVLRKYVVLKGRTRDMVMFSFLSTDPMVG